MWFFIFPTENSLESPVANSSCNSKPQEANNTTVPEEPMVSTNHSNKSITNPGDAENDDDDYYYSGTQSDENAVNCVTMEIYVLFAVLVTVLLNHWM